MNNQSEKPTCPHGYPAELKGECPSCKKLLEIYQDDSYETLYRYENPNTPYDEQREGVVSKKELVGGWFTNKLDDLSTYIKARQPNGKVVTVRVPKSDIEKFDATKLPETKDMDIEVGNYIIPDNIQQETRIEIPLAIETVNPKKFLMKDWQKVNDFIASELTADKILHLIKNN